MITPEMRRKMESKWSPEDRAAANTGRLAKFVVLMAVVLGVTLIGARDKAIDAPQVASAAAYSPR